MYDPNSNDMEKCGIPDYMQGALKRWIEDGKAPGHFLSALLNNNLKETFARADDVNAAHVRNYIRYLYNYAPSDCWGSPAKVQAWKGLNNELEQA